MPTRVILPTAEEVQKIPGMHLLIASIAHYVRVAEFSTKPLAIAVVYSAVLQGFGLEQCQVAPGERTLLRIVHNEETYEVRVCTR